MHSITDAFYFVAAAALGLALGFAALPWRNTAFRNQSTLEYWVIWMTLWWALAAFGLWTLLQTYRSAWSEYLAKNRAIG